MNALPALGSKFDGRRRALVAIAELVRRDVKTAIADGLLPTGTAAHVRVTGLGVRILVRACPSVVFLSTRRVLAELRGDQRVAEMPRLSRDGTKLLRALSALANAYQPPRHGFLVHVGYHPELVARLRAEIVSAITGSRAA